MKVSRNSKNCQLRAAFSRFTSDISLSINWSAMAVSLLKVCLENTESSNRTNVWEVFFSLYCGIMKQHSSFLNLSITRTNRRPNEGDIIYFIRMEYMISWEQSLHQSTWQAHCNFGPLSSVPKLNFHTKTLPYNISKHYFLDF